MRLLLACCCLLYFTLPASADLYRYIDEDNIVHFAEGDKPPTSESSVGKWVKVSKPPPSGWYVITDRGGSTHCEPLDSPSGLINATKRAGRKYSTKDDLVKNGKVYIMTLKTDSGIDLTYIRGIDLCKSVLKKVKANDASETQKYR